MIYMVSNFTVQMANQMALQPANDKKKIIGENLVKSAGGTLHEHWPMAD